MSEDVNIVIADDSATNKHGTTTEIGRKGQTEWRARWVGRESTYQEIQATDPRVVVVRLEPKIQQALALVRRIYRDFPHVAILAGTIQNSNEIVRQAVQCGADECLTGMIDRASLTSACARIASRRGWDDAYADSRVIPLFSAKGRVRCTPIATHLAQHIASQAEAKTAESVGKVKEARPAVVKVAADGTVWIDDRQVAEVQLEKELERLVKLSKDRTIILKGDRGADYGVVVHVLDLARSVGATTIQMSAVKPKARED